MLERGCSMRDIMHTIANGSLTGSEFAPALANWKYTFKGEDLDGGGVVLAVGTQYRCVVVTVLS